MIRFGYYFHQQFLMNAATNNAKWRGETALLAKKLARIESVTNLMK